MYATISSQKSFLFDQIQCQELDVKAKWDKKIVDFVEPFIVAFFRQR